MGDYLEVGGMMGQVIHDAVIAVIDMRIVEGAALDGLNLYPELPEFLEQLPEQLRCCVVGPFKSPHERLETWLWLPDGSKEGWAESYEADRWREHFVSLFNFSHELHDPKEAQPHHVVGVRFGPSIVGNYLAPHVTTMLGVES